jgi:hypothetical protein
MQFVLNYISGAFIEEVWIAAMLILLIVVN